MECFSTVFVSLVRDLLDGAELIVATVAIKDTNSNSEVKGRKDVLIREVTEQNRKASPSVKV